VLQKNKKLQHAFHRFFLERKLLENYAQPSVMDSQMVMSPKVGGHRGLEDEGHVSPHQTPTE
jgi:hypothetical protein